MIVVKERSIKFSLYKKTVETKIRQDNLFLKKKEKRKKMDITKVK